jgi:DNA polymerase-3 subunit epsilon
MTSWRNCGFAVVDVETTGLDSYTHEVLSIGIVHIDDGRIPVSAAYYKEIRPDVPPTRETIVVHGIVPSRAAVAESRSDIGPMVLDQINGRVLVAHVASIELTFLANWLGPLGWRAPRLVIDTDVLARRWLSDEIGIQLKSHIGLGAAAQLFGLPEERRHHALGDALTTAQLFLALARRFGDGNLSPSRLGRLRPRSHRWRRTGARSS